VTIKTSNYLGLSISLTLNEDLNIEQLAWNGCTFTRCTLGS